MRPYILFAGMLSLFCQALFSQDTLVVAADMPARAVGKYMYTLEDPSGNISIAELLGNNHPAFTRQTKEVFAFAHRETYVWAKLNLVNKTGKDLWLSIGNGATDSILYYQTKANRILVSKMAGDKVPFSYRDIQTNKLLFRVGDRPDNQTIYLRFNIRLPRQFPVTLATADQLFTKETSVFFMDGLLYGMLLMILLYNLFVWLVVKDNAYLFYVLYILFVSVSLMHFDGLTYAWFWRTHPVINDHPAIISSVSMFFAILFVSSFLHLKKVNRLLWKGLVVLSACMLLSCAISIAGYKFLALQLSQSVAFAGAVYFLLIGIRLYRQGYTPARYYLLGWTSLILGLLVFLAKDMAWVPYNFFTAYSLKFGVETEAILMAFALADKINFYKAERRKAIREKIVLEATYESERKIAGAERLRVEEELRHAGLQLTDYMENLRQKNNLIEQFRCDVEHLETQLKNASIENERSEQLDKLLQSTILTDKDWIEFRKLFDKVHRGYLSRLKEAYANLTETDIRLICLTRLQMSQKEMSTMLGITTEAVRKAKQRLRKKIDLPQDSAFGEWALST